ncbi:MAG TPA: tetratricopeptide repeat protein, partial [Nitrospirota bacterium]
MLKKPTVTGSVPILLIIAGGILPYITALGNTFAWDDIYLVVKNPYIRGWDNLPGLFTTGYWASIGKTGGLYRPLTMLSFLTEHSLAGLSPLVYHIDNILLHTACSLLVYFIVRELVVHRYAPLFAALLFAVHPVHTEAVAWVSGRAELLATLFFLLAFLGFLRHWGGRLWFLVSPALFLLGVLSKETAAMLPAVIFLYLLLVDRERRPSAFIRALAPYAAVLAVYLPVRLIVLSGHVGPEENIFQHVSGYGAFLAMSKAFMYYIRLLFVPVGLSAAYLFPPPESFFSLPVVLFWSLVAAVALLSPWLARRRPSALLFMLWMPVCLLPVSNIVPSEILMAERVLYLPSAGFCAVAGILAAKAADTRKYLTFGVAALVVLSFGAMSLDRNGVWRDEQSIHTELASINRRVIAEFPRYVQLYNNLADSSIILGRYQDAQDALKQAIELDP